MSRTAKSIIAITFFVLSTLILFLGFFNNFWHVQNQQIFQTGLINSDRFIMGRLLESRRDGIFSKGGLVGVVKLYSNTSVLTYDNYPYQLQAYLANMNFVGFGNYNSQIGGQGMFFSFFR